MPDWLARRSVWIVGAAVVLVILVMAGLPLIASTQIVRDRIAFQMSAWSGYRVKLNNPPEIHVWPTFRAVLSDVTLLDWNEAEPKTVLAAERVEMDLSALAALRGDVVFTRMRLVRPVLRLTERNEKLRLPAPQDWGRLNRSVETARDAVSKAPTDPDTSGLPGDTFGTIEFEQGRVIADDGNQQTNIVTSLSGSLEWPALNRQVALLASGIWHGESVSLTASSTQPLILLGGGRAPLTFSIQAAPANVSFTGSASLAGDNFIDGQLKIAAPSLAGLIDWTHALSLPTNSVGPVELSARIVGDVRRLKFEDTALNIAGSSGNGLIDVSFSAGDPLVAGTLAFDTLNLPALIQAFSPISTGPTNAEGLSQSIGGGDFDFDLRFSAANATFGNATLTNVAAAAKVNDELATFDISDATAFGGTIQFGVRADRTEGRETVELRMVGEQIDLSRLAAALGRERLVPQAPCTFSLALKGPGADLQSVLRSGSGTVSASLGPGTISGLNLDAFFEHSAAGEFFPLSAIEEGSLPIDGAEFKASITKGVAGLETAVARSGAYTISLDGLVPLAGRALALYGRISESAEDEASEEAPLSFFVGGSWSAPFIAPLTNYR